MLSTKPLHRTVRESSLQFPRWTAPRCNPRSRPDRQWLLLRSDSLSPAAGFFARRESFLAPLSNITEKLLQADLVANLGKPPAFNRTKSFQNRFPHMLWIDNRRLLSNDLLLLQTPQSFAHYFAGIRVPAALHFVSNELCEVRRNRNIQLPAVIAHVSIHYTY